MFLMLESGEPRPTEEKVNITVMHLVSTRAEPPECQLTIAHAISEVFIMCHCLGPRQQVIQVEEGGVGGAYKINVLL